MVIKDKVLVIGPNRQAVDHAKNYELVPREAKYVHEAHMLNGYHKPTVYVVDYGHRPNQAFFWNSRTNERHRSDMLTELRWCEATIIRVELP